MDTNQSLITRWAKFFITRYRISILILITIVIAGLWGVTNNQRQDFPAIPINFVFVSAVYPGASPADVEQEVIIPIEQAANTLDGVDSVRSSARNSFGSVQITLKDSSIVDETITKLSDKVNKLGLPSEVSTKVQSVEAGGPSIALGLVGLDGQNTEDLIQYAENVKSEIESASSDIDHVEISPDNEYNIKITLDAELLTKNFSQENKTFKQQRIINKRG